MIFLCFFYDFRCLALSWPWKTMVLLRKSLEIIENS